MSKTAPPPTLWSQEWAMDRVARAIKYLAENYPECGGSEVLDPHLEAVHEAALREDRCAYEEALREYMRAGKSEALAIRKGAA